MPVKLKQILLLLAASFIGITVINSLNLSRFWTESSDTKTLDGLNPQHQYSKRVSDFAGDNNGLPVILWWTDFMKDPGSVMQCGHVSCYMTNNRKYKGHKDTKMFLFYGTRLELHDLPLPRLPQEQWALIHEESPKNNWAFCNDKFMTLFNHTATFRRNSDYPVTLQWLTSIKDIESKQYYKTVEEKNRYMEEEGLAPIAYVNSDCGAPSNRDKLVKMLSKYVKVDCMGRCLHNKDLPKHLKDPMKGMGHSDFYELLSKYKFVIAAENAICEDYITEKFWRSFYVGTVPIVYGSPSIKEWLPMAETAVVVNDFLTVKELADHIIYLNTNNTAYSHYIRYKLTGITNSYLRDQMEKREYEASGKPGHHFYATYPCNLCQYIHSSVAPTSKTAQSLGCPAPRPFPTDGSEGLQSLAFDDWFGQEFLYRQYQIEAFQHFYELKMNWTYLDLHNYLEPKVLKDFPHQKWLKLFQSYALRSKK